MSLRTAFVFPGQGSHRAGMASAWLPTAGELFTELSDATGLDLVAVADDADACGSSTRLGQPAVTAVSLAALAALREAGVTPDVVAGHSLGEVTAAAAAQVFTAAECVALVAARGRAFGAACRTSPGTMAAVLRVDLGTVETVVAGCVDVAVANVNAPGQVVLSGTAAGLATATGRLRELGARVLPLDVEGAFHSPAMTPAVAALSTALAWVPVRDPQLPLVSGVDGHVRTTGTQVRRALTDGVLAPVRWVAVQRSLVALGVDVLVEVGPGGVLSGLARRTAPELTVVTVATPEDVEACRAVLAGLERDRARARVAAAV